MPAIVGTGTPIAPTSIEGILKTYYTGALRNSINNESMIETLTTKDTENVSGTTANIVIHGKRNSGTGFGEQTSTVQTAGNQGYFQVPTPTRKIWGSWRVSAEAEAASKDSKGAWDSVQKREMIDLKNDIKNVKDKTFILGGTTPATGAARLSRVDAATAAAGALNTFVLGDDSNVTDARRAVYFEEGMKIDFFDVVAVAFLAGGTAREITSVSLAAGTITISGAALDVNANTIITFAGSIANGTSESALGTSLAMQGLDNIINSTTLFTVSPATQPKFQAMNGNPFVDQTTPDVTNLMTEKNIGRVLDQHAIAGNGDVVDIILCALTNARQYEDDIKIRERRQVETLTLTSGRGALAYMRYGKKIAIIPDRLVMAGISYAWVKEHLALYEARPLDWFDFKGNILLQVPGTTMQEAILFGLQELAPRVRNSSWRVDNWSRAF